MHDTALEAEVLELTRREDFPAFIVVDDKGHDFFATATTPLASTIRVRAGA